jgi:hypothetical protein
MGVGLPEPAAGAEIVVGPRVAGDLMHLTTGGPIFEFRFKCSDGTGLLQNELAPEIMRDEVLSRSWLLEKYLVRIDRR